MSETIKDPRFSKAAFYAHFKPWIKEEATPGDFYLIFKERAATLADLNEVCEMGYPRGPYVLTIKEVFKNYAQAKRLEV